MHKKKGYLSVQKRQMVALPLALAMLSAPALGAETATAVPSQAAPATGAAPVQLSDIEVQAPKAPKDASAAVGYRSESVSVGPLGDKNPMEVPYVITAVPSDLFENQPTTGMAGLTKYVPSAQYEARGGMFIGRPGTRGFEGTISENNRIDGLNVCMTTAYPMEQFERIEVLNGLAGSLYGPSAPSGVFNLVLKRPTEKQYFELDVNNVSYGGARNNTYYHADLSGPLAHNFGYRVNLLFDNGQEWAPASSIKRDLASIALDWHGLPNTVVETNFSYYDLKEQGFPAGFSYASSSVNPATNIHLPAALDPTRAGYGQQWAGYELTTRTMSARVKHDFSEDWHLSAGFLDQNASRNVFQVLNTLTDNSGNYKTTLGALPNANSTIFAVDSEFVDLNGHLKTGPLTHDLFLGTNGHQRTSTTLRTVFATQTVGTANVSNPVSFDEPVWNQKQGYYKSAVIQQQALTFGDTISYKNWSLIGTSSYSWLNSTSYNATGATTNKSNDSGASFGVSITNKPVENLMVYLSYANSLQQGDIAPATAVNANQTMSPFRSTQYEAGAKLALAKVDLTSAIFRINRPYAFTGADNVFSNQGEQVNYGAELMATGDLTDRIKVFSGITVLNPKLKDTDNANTNNKSIIGVPKVQANVYAEYRMPFITGLTPSLNVHYVDRRAGDAENSTWAKAYTTLDLGVRYATKMLGTDTTWRLTVNNVTDERYWASVMPSNINGGAATNPANPATAGLVNTAYLGTPREIIASMQIKF